MDKFYEGFKTNSKFLKLIEQYASNLSGQPTSSGANPGANPGTALTQPQPTAQTQATSTAQQQATAAAVKKAADAQKQAAKAELQTLQQTSQQRIKALQNFLAGKGPYVPPSQ